MQRVGQVPKLISSLSAVPTLPNALHLFATEVKCLEVKSAELLLWRNGVCSLDTQQPKENLARKVVQQLQCLSVKAWVQGGHCVSRGIECRNN